MDQLFDFIKDYGGYAGAASVLGLAVLSLLYFAQAREVRRLREWAGRAPERAAELEQRVSEAARRPAPAPAVPRQPGKPQTAAAQAAARPAPANGQTGAAPASAPAPAVGAGAAAAAAAAPGAAPAGPQAVAASPPAAPGAPAKGDGDGGEAEKPGQAAGGEQQTEASDAIQAPPATGTPPATPAPGAPAAGGTPPATPAPGAPAAGATPPPPIPPRTAAARPRTPAPTPRPAAPLRSGSVSAASRPATAAPQGRRRLPVILIAAAVGVVLVGVALALMLGGDDSEPTQAQGTNVITPPAGGQSASTTGTGGARPRGETKVAVLNGTTIAGLAAKTAEELKGAGYSLGTVADAQEQNRSATLVQYGQDARGEAQAVARLIGVGADAVSPLDVNTRTVAGDDARVVVTVGADQNQNQQSGQG